MRGQIILILDTDVLIDIEIEKTKRKKGRDSAKELIRILIKEVQPIAIWIPKEVQREFYYNVPQEAERIMEMFIAVARAVDVFVSRCPISDRNLRTGIAREYRWLGRGELDAIHQARLLERVSKYKDVKGKVLSGDKDLLNINEFVDYIIDWSNFRERYDFLLG